MAYSKNTRAHYTKIVPKVLNDMEQNPTENIIVGLRPNSNDAKHLNWFFEKAAEKFGFTILTFETAIMLKPNAQFVTDNSIN